MLVLGTILCMTLIVGVLLFRQKNTEPKSYAAVARDAGVDTSGYRYLADKDMTEFINLHVRDVLAPFTEESDSRLAEEFSALRQEIINRYGQEAKVVFYGNRAPNGDHVAMNAGIGADGAPYVGIVVPELMNMYFSMIKTEQPFAEEKYGGYVQTIMLHELIHLSLGHPRPSREFVSREQQVNHESEAWLITCRDVLVAMVSEHRPFSQGQLLVYNQWLETRQGADSIKWESFVTSTLMGKK